MKRTLLIFTTLALCAVSCGTVGSYTDSDRFRDGIYYKPDPTKVNRSPLSEDDFRYLASLDNFHRGTDTLSVERDTVYVALTDPYDWTYYDYWRPYRWNYYSRWGYYSYWGSPYYWGYDPFYWDYGWHSPYFYGYPYYGYPYYYGWGNPYYHHHGLYSWNDSGTRVRREGSATSGHYSHPGVPQSPSVTRTASAMAKHDIDRIKVGRSGPKTTAVNRDTGYSEISNYRSGGATRVNSAASYNSSSSSSRYESSSSSSRSTTSSSSRSSGYSGGGSHSSGSSHSSHSSGGGGYHGGGHR